MSITAEQGLYTCDCCKRKLPLESFRGGQLNSETGEWRCGDCEHRLRCLNHFVRIARRGRGRGSSGGEKAAAKLARVFLDDGLRLDDAAIAGFVEFMRMAKHSPETMRDQFEG